MKLTESKLREIIKEEIQKLNEGATQLGQFVNANSEAKIEKWFKTMQKKDAKQYGKNPYGANWTSFDGIEIVYGKTFSDSKQDRKKAFDYITNNSEKYGPALAVRIVSNGKPFGYAIGGWVAE
jgi:hypothetical protein